MDVPSSMKTELAAWNQGRGIDLQSWTGCEGRFGLAIGYSAIFWPELVEFDGYILRQGFSEASLREFEKQDGSTRQDVERVMSHLHIADIQYQGCPDLSKDKILALGTVFKELLEAKLKWQFPNRPCEVEFYIPKDENDLREYQVFFCQRT